MNIEKIKNYNIPNKLDIYLREVISQALNSKLDLSELDRCKYAESLCCMGYTARQITQLLNTDKSTINRYLNKLKKGDKLKKAPAVVAEVVASSISNACGLKHTLRMFAHSKNINCVELGRIGNLISQIEKDLFKTLNFLMRVSRQIKKGHKDDNRKN